VAEADVAVEGDEDDAGADSVFVRPFGSASGAAAASVVPCPPWQELEPRLFPAAGLLAASTLAALSAASRGLRRRVASDEGLWAETYATTFGESCPSARLAAASAASSSSSSGSAEARIREGFTPSYVEFLKQWRLVKDRVCPACDKKAMIVPVAHGFPSTKLQAVQRRRLCMLAENCGFLGPFWVCLHCRAEWEHYPFLSTSVCRRRGPFPGGRSGPYGGTVTGAVGGGGDIVEEEVVLRSVPIRFDGPHGDGRSGAERG